MRLKKTLCQNWKLYVVTGPGAGKNDSLEKTVKEAVEGGADVIQLRDKNATEDTLLKMARALLKILRPRGVPLIINDSVRVAKLSGADGVHLGQDDGALGEARSILGKEAVIGRSTHSRKQAKEAEKEGFDYIGVGPVFKTPTKPSAAPVGLDLVRFASQNIHIPFVAIGGIDIDNIREVREAGAKIIAVARAVCGAKDPRKACEKLLREITNE